MSAPSPPCDPINPRQTDHESNARVRSDPAKSCGAAAGTRTQEHRVRGRPYPARPRSHSNRERRDAAMNAGKKQEGDDADYVS